MNPIPQISPYKALPTEITRKVNINKAYKKAQKTRNVNKTIVGLWLLASIAQFMSRNFSLGAANLCIACLYNSIVDKDSVMKSYMYRDAYDEIVAKAKYIKEINKDKTNLKDITVLEDMRSI